MASTPSELTSPPVSLSERTLRELLDQTAAKTPAPGGGAVVSAAAALAASLGNMVVSFSEGKKRLAAHSDLHREAANELGRAVSILLELADEDAAAYDHLNRLQRLDADDPERSGLAGAALAATMVPLAVAAAASDVLRVLERLVGTSNAYLRSDLAIAAILANAAVRAARWNVLVNLPALGEAGVSEDQADDLLGAATDLQASSEQRAHAIEDACRVGW